MLGKFKYLISFTLFQTICSAIALVITGSSSPVRMYLYILIPIISLILTIVLYSYIPWVQGGAYIILFAFSVLFWVDVNMTQYINLNFYSLVCMLFFFIHLIFSIVYPKSSPENRSRIGWNMPQFMDEPAVWRLTHTLVSAICAGWLIPDIIVCLYIPNHYKLVIAATLFVLSVFTYKIIPYIIAKPILRVEENKIQKELKEQIKKEQGYL